MCSNGEIMKILIVKTVVLLIFRKKNRNKYYELI